MRILALDVGERRIGVAMSDSLGLTAQPLMVLVCRSTAADVGAIASLVTEHGASAVVVGLPLTMRGEQGPQAKKVLAFVEHLRPKLGIPIHLADERLTTLQGERALLEIDTPRRKRKEVIDQVAAQLILQHFLDLHRHTPQS